ncbi:MAG: carbohydrate kinase family protein [Alphaproteobacteria bacterium]|nr:carbohydrate kinase family protein [Alphaproteobacteria bacterium]
MRAITVGSLVQDIIVIVADAAIEQMRMSNATSSFLLLEAGKKVDTTTILETCGGGAANAAVALARLGFDAAILGKIGTDSAAAFLKPKLEAEGVDLSRVTALDDAPTGRSVIIIAHDRDPAILVNRGANTRLACEEVEDASFAGVDLVCVTPLSGQSADCYGALVARAKSAGAYVLAIPGIRQLSSRGEEFLASLPQVDTVIVNRREASQLVALVARGLDAGRHRLEAADASSGPMPRLLAGGLEHGGFALTFADFAAAILARGARTLVITDGSQGAVAVEGESVVHAPIVEAEIVATVGAGDAFATTFAAMQVEGGSLERALGAAAVNAASVIGALDTQSNLLRREALERGVAALSPERTRSWRLVDQDRGSRRARPPRRAKARP